MASVRGNKAVNNMDQLTHFLRAAGITPTAIDHISITGKDPILPSHFLIGEAGALALAGVGYTIAALWFLKTGRRQQVSIDVRDAAIFQCAHQYLKVLSGETPALWDPVSGFYATKDQRFIQLHCNFPHHRQGVVAFLKCADDKAAVAAAILQSWSAEALETALSKQGLCAAMVRTPAEWAAHPQAAAVSTLPLMEIIKVADSAPEPLPEGDRPLSGVKMLDLTRVIAGPVAAKLLAEQGATVLHITSPHLPCILPLVMETGYGKLSAHVNFHDPAALQQVGTLIDSADIFLESYRPNGLDQFGLSPDALFERRPGLIYASLNAYSHKGPWKNRHGYDSLVQSATGIAYEQSNGQSPPKHLPAQTLDYISGCLTAIGIAEALRRRATEGGSYWVRVSLAQTAHWFKQLGRTQPDDTCKVPAATEIPGLLTQDDTAFGRLEHLLPVLAFSETPSYWDKPTVPLGTHLAAW